MPRRQEQFVLPLSVASARACCTLAFDELGFEWEDHDDPQNLCGKESWSGSTWPLRIDITLLGEDEANTSLTLSGKIGGMGPIQSKHLTKRMDALAEQIRIEAGLAPRPSSTDVGTTASGSEAIAGVVGRVGKKAFEEIAANCSPGERPVFIIGSGMGGAIAAFSDRCLIVKKGGLTSFMAGATGGGRTAIFHYTDIVAIEYNSGWMNGTLEILTPSHTAGQASDYWKTGGGSGNGSSAWELANVLPLPKSEYEVARPLIDKMRAMVAEAKRPGAPLSTSVRSEDLASQLAQLSELREQGALNQEEFQEAKRRVLRQSP